MASSEQWEFLLDLELWKKDRLESRAGERLDGTLLQADPDRLVRWLLSEGDTSPTSTLPNLQCGIQDQG